jgi:hypothetical protein
MSPAAIILCTVQIVLTLIVTGEIAGVHGWRYALTFVAICSSLYILALGALL